MWSANINNLIEVSPCKINLEITNMTYKYFEYFPSDL